MKTMLRRNNQKRQRFNGRALLVQAAIDPRIALKALSSVIFSRVSGALSLAVGFNPRDGQRGVLASRQRRLNSSVADATRKTIRGRHHGLMVIENIVQPVAPKRCACVLAGRLLATRLPARTRAHRWLNLILKDHQPTAKFKRRPAAEKALALCSMAIVLCASLSIRTFGQELEAPQQFVQSANTSNAGQRLLREGRELVGERKWAAATTKFNDLIRAYPRDKNLEIGRASCR